MSYSMRLFTDVHGPREDGLQQRVVAISRHETPDPKNSMNLGFTTQEGDDEKTILAKASRALYGQFEITKNWTQEGEHVWSGECIRVRRTK